MQISLPLIANLNLKKNLALILLFRVTHQTACLGILHSQTLLIKFLCSFQLQGEVWLILTSMLLLRPNISGCHHG